MGKVKNFVKGAILTSTLIGALSSTANLYITSQEKNEVNVKINDYVVNTMENTSFTDYCKYKCEELKQDNEEGKITDKELNAGLYKYEKALSKINDEEKLNNSNIGLNDVNLTSEYLESVGQSEEFDNLQKQEEKLNDSFNLSAGALFVGVPLAGAGLAELSKLNDNIILNDENSLNQ